MFSLTYFQLVSEFRCCRSVEEASCNICKLKFKFIEKFYETKTDICLKDVVATQTTTQGFLTF